MPSMESSLQGKTLVAQRFARSSHTYDDAAIIQRRMALQLVRMLERLAPDRCFEQVLEFGCGTGLLTDHLVKRFAIEQLSLNDMVPNFSDVAQRCRSIQPAIRVKLCPGDMESIELPSDQDLVVSNAVLQWAANPTRMLARMIAATRPGGLLALATFGPNNLRETRDLTGTSLRYLSLAAIETALAPHAELFESQEQIHTVRFESAFAVLQHLKRTGVNSLQQRRWSPRQVREFCDDYEARFRSGTKVPLTYHPILIVARRRENERGER